MKPTYEEIWKKLSSIDCSSLIHQKSIGGGKKLDYLSWMNAWKILMEHYPSATYTFYDNAYEENGSVTVSCSVQIGECSRTMFLPVMNNKNQGAINPTSKDISDNRMRCFVKCLAMFGLGSYIFIKDGLPTVSESPITAMASAPQPESLSAGEHILYNDTLIIPCGDGKGKSYEEVYNDNLTQIDRHIKYHSNPNNPNTNSLHLRQLMAYKRAVQCEPSNGVA